MFKAVIFDWDGTLADTRKVVVASFQKALKDINCEINDHFIERLIGVGSSETFLQILKSSNISYNETLVKNLVKKKVKNEIEMSNNVKLFPGSIELLESLQAKVKLGLASMNDQKVISNLLELTNTSRFFDVVLTADDISKPKPDPEIFLKCGKNLKINQEKCAVVEDSIFGVEATKKANMGSIAVTTGVYSRSELKRAGADLLINSLENKETILSFVLK